MATSFTMKERFFMRILIITLSVFFMLFSQFTYSQHGTRSSSTHSQKYPALKTATDWFESANRKHDVEDYQGAIAAFTKAIKLKPDYADAYYGRASTKYLIADYNGSIADYTEAIKLKPDADAYYVRGLAKSAMKDYQGAIADYTEAIKLKKDYADAYYGRGLAFLQLNQKSKALENFRKAIALGYRVRQELLDSCK
jgi:tetratricopeptide (TPR) repeat protein